MADKKPVEETKTETKRPLTRRYNKRGKRRGRYAYAAPLGMLISLWVIIGSCMMMDLGGWIAFVIFCIVGAALYAGMTIYRKKNGEELKTFTPADIVEE